MTEITPTIETARLVLRAHPLDDFDDAAAMWGDPVVTRHIGGKPFSPEEVWARLLRYSGHWSLLGYGFWLVADKASGRFVGEVGLADFHRGVDGFDGDPECGWVLAPWSHGQGLATEAVQAALTWGGRHFGARRSVCMIDPDNPPSIRVAQRCGYREYARSTYHDSPCVLFETTLSATAR